uniref:SET domain-containing protein n=1 Tax=Kalanchoe fedtschenkoi TaxID=63787 RepID=A0A7N0THB2_KALFE
MEKLKSIIPDRIKRTIEESGPEDLPSTCSTLLHWCLQTPLFHKILGELAGSDTALCGKNMEAALDFKRQGNSFFTKGDYASALHFYSKALRLAPIDAQDMEKNLVATLYVNRASSLYKMDRLVECLRDCNRAIVISPSYAKAWYRRGVANAALGNNHHATCDLKISGILEPSPSGKGHVERELKETRDKCRNKSSSVVHQDGRSQSCIDEKPKMKLNIVHTPTKGRGLTTEVDIPEATLVHTEQPYAMIILKRFRDTYCHYCFKELPVDVNPCPSCSIPVYCSQDCQLRAGGMFERNIPKSNSIHKSIPDELQKHIAEVIVTDRCKLDDNHFAEHRHECKGVNWPAVLPPDIVLAGRILCKAKHLADSFEHQIALDLAHNYAQTTPEDKLEFHIYAIVLLSCLQQSHDPKIQPDGVLIAQLVILISQIKVNSMAVVHMKSTDINVAPGESRAGGPSSSTLEQIRVGQAIYLSGSLFNHSCQPNVHAYFISRTLFVRSTKFVAAGCTLEISYGPQVGQWDLKDRQQRLHNDYSFECQCEGCVDLNLSDLVLNAFGCADRSCSGVVLEIGAAEYEKKRLRALQSSPNTSPSKQLQQHQVF